PQREDGRILGRAFGAAIGALIVVGTVAVLFAVRLVVLVLVARPIVQRKAVMHRDVVDRGTRPAPVVLELGRRAGHAMGEIADQIAVAAPEAPRGLAVEVVPLRPAGRKGADLIAAGPDIPRFGDQLYVAEHRVLPHGGEEGGVGLEGRRAPECGGEVEAEAVDVKYFDP